MYKSIRSVLMLAIAFTLSMSTALAQDTGTITGQLTDQKNGEPLISANIFIQSINKGAATDADGNFTINNVPYGDYQLRISYIGYKTETLSVTVDQETVTINEALAQDIASLDDIVVTALGVERQERSLGYSVQAVEGEDLNKTQETNFVSTLTGKVAGANISNSNAMGGSSRIVLRGAKSVAGNNEPLFVVDGVPLDNSNFADAGQATGGGGYDYGNAASVINPNDVKSVSVLKGPSAAALYGSRAANGVIQITTKSGSANQGRIGVTLNSGVTMRQVYGLPEYQNQYGGGANAPFTVNDQGQFVADFATDESWGPRLDGRLVRQWYSYDNVNGLLGEATPWVAQPGNVQDFFDTGVSINNNLSLANGGDNYSYRLSLSNITENGVYPESQLDRSQVGFNGSLELTEKLNTSVSVNYSNSDATGRPGTGYDNQNVFLQFNHFGQRQLDLGSGSRLQNIFRPDGSQRAWNWDDPVAGSIRFTDNPYWVRRQNFQNDDTQRIYGNFSIGYNLTDYLDLTGNVRTDYYTDRRAERVAVGAQAVSRYEEDIYEVQETNAKLTLSYKRDLNESFSLNAFAAGNIRYNDRNTNIGATQGGLSAPGVYSLENSISRPAVTDRFQEQEVQSLLGSTTVGYQEKLYLDATVRNDWSSTLPDGNNSFLYPSVSLSYVFSEDLVDNSGIFSFGKLRAGLSRVGSATDPYRLNSTFPFSTPFGALPQLSVSNTLNNPNLKPEQTTSWEVGTALEFFNNRLTLDATYYNDLTEDQIVAVEVSRASGFSQQLINAGKISNKGLEVALTGTPLQMDNGLRWDVSVNWAKNVSKVEELAPGLDNLTLGNAPFGVSINARVDETYGALVGTDFVYDENGNKVLNANGTYRATSSPEVLGSYVPDWNAGVSSTLSFKGFTASIALDGQKGGDIYSITNLFGRFSGILAETAENDIREVGFTPEGVLEDGTEFTGTVDPETFYKSLFSVKAAHVYDASYIKLREVSLGYDMPQKWFQTLPIRGLRVSVIGRNVATLFKNTPNFDPTNVLSAGNVQGIEAGQIPPQRSFGFNLRLDL